ncbi:ABC transporter ATP-binding protein [Ramlibacter tataouinensis]|uniref:Candidate ABC type branched chain amino acid transport systems, ATP-binding component n=1 Tax=Ramlibacter tataouinensis (strain ATCC BAA-407 / DSM 14655 / LMG 21543 / TTB310) TaxID=365046 RepID=F5Y1Q7_RAMTT|nr:ABC transporter ATP-binding protein [Ramlibacter tataouinensis]AEG92308.1 candidate ABC type branched chain amino acid transport systems, ATP-binding component [Ramlibacter tataouinensis TTB310]
MLRFENVSQHYGSFRALNGVNLEARDGELVVLLGANGAGKSSIFLTASGLNRASGGSIRFRNQELVGMKPSQIVELGVVLCPEGRKLFPQMSVLQNLMLGAYVHRGDKAGNQRKLDEVYSLFPILAERSGQAAGSLSGGQQQMVAIARALMGRPQTLLLDEPSLGLAPLVVKQVFEVIQRINRAGTTVLLAEQNAYAALKIAHRAYVIESGRIVMEGAPDALMNNTAVRKAYIGA